MDTKTEFLKTLVQDFGWKVFPADSGKHPLVKWTEQATNDWEQVESWLDEFPGCSWGMPTNEIFVVDLDVKTENNGIENFQALPGYTKANTLTVRTKSGGLHLYFQQPEQLLRNSTSKIAPGIDTRGDGGFVIIPPSDGYKFLNVPSIEKIKPLPEWLAKLIVKKPVEVAEPIAKGKIALPSREKKNGTRNTEMFKIACKAFETMPRGEAISFIIGENILHCDPPLDETELQTIAESAEKTVHEKAGSWSKKETPSKHDLFLNRVRTTELGNADLFVEQNIGKVLYNRSFGFLVWDGEKWVKDSELRVMALAQQTVRDIYRQAADAVDTALAKELADWATESLSRQKISAMIDLAKPHLFSEIDDFDAYPTYLNVKNGVVDLENGELLPHNPNFRLTQVANASYEPGADCPNWKAMLEMVFEGNKNKIKYLQKIIGYSASGKTDAKCLFFLYGKSGDNGKSTIIETLFRLFGSYAYKTDISAILNRNQGGVTPHLANFPGKRLIVTSEIDHGRKWNIGVVKDITGQDTLSVNPKHMKAFTFQPTHKLWIYGNAKPDVEDGGDAAFWERMKLLEFGYRIPAEKQIPMSRLFEIFEAEFSGILNWIVEGYQAYMADPLLNNDPEEITAAVQEYMAETNIYSQFISEECDVSNPDAKTPKDELYNLFLAWKARQHDRTEVSMKKFTQQIGNLGYQRGGNGNKFYKGISAKESPVSTINFFEEE